MRSKKTIVIGMIVLILVPVCVYIIIKEFYYVHSDVQLKQQEITLLRQLGDTALTHLDVPVSSILLYNDSIIGRGYNTVLAQNNAGGHAEINAISSAIALFGKRAFDSLDRDKLVLISTFEPCLMCQGAFVEYRIKKVVFLKSKTLTQWTRQYIQVLRYEIIKRQGRPVSLQDSLFMLHPLYGKNK